MVNSIPEQVVGMWFLTLESWGSFRLCRTQCAVLRRRGFVQVAPKSQDEALQRQNLSSESEQCGSVYSQNVGIIDALIRRGFCVFTRSNHVYVARQRLEDQSS